MTSHGHGRLVVGVGGQGGGQVSSRAFSGTYSQGRGGGYVVGVEGYPKKFFLKKN